jgi:PilZ domain
MEIIYAGAANHVTIICPKCGLKKNINVTKFKETHKRLKAKCKCGEVFPLSLEFRRYHRKIVQLTGEYFVQDKDEKGEVLIKDISMTGINFEALKPHNIAKHDTVELKFTLDNPDKTELNTLVKIMWVSDLNFGGHFIDQNRFKQDLVLYLTT